MRFLQTYRRTKLNNGKNADEPVLDVIGFCNLTRDLLFGIAGVFRVRRI